MNRIIVFIIVISRRITAERPAAVNYHLNRPGTLITGCLKRLVDINGVRIRGFGPLAVCGFDIHHPQQNPYIRPKRVRLFVRIYTVENRSSGCVSSRIQCAIQ